ncbi:hypothetical protein JHK82_037700 [Glycine max]|uniref:Uncharacterized protein n=1 Tax=Glycine soja TaxID=3848 RepID=A0A445IBY9_GLYSO|nr:hypothetical protein JHK82_037700 [Glycine max]RZB83563.1 hypothetical protein D0Y65_032209 [Glycine soja]
MPNKKTIRPNCPPSDPSAEEHVPNPIVSGTHINSIKANVITYIPHCKANCKEPENNLCCNRKCSHTK